MLHFARLSVCSWRQPSQSPDSKAHSGSVRMIVDVPIKLLHSQKSVLASASRGIASAGSPASHGDLPDILWQQAFTFSSATDLAAVMGVSRRWRALAQSVAVSRACLTNTLGPQSALSLACS